MDGIDLDLRRIVGLIRLVQQPQLHGAPVVAGLLDLRVPGEHIFAHLAQIVQIMPVVDDLELRMLFDEVDIFRGYMRSVQIGKMQVFRMIPYPVPYPGLHRRSVKYLHAHLLQSRGVRLLMQEVISQELYLIAFIQQHPDILICRARARVPVPCGHIVIHHEDYPFAAAPLAGAERIGIACIFVLLCEPVRPFLRQLDGIVLLIFLQPRAVHIRAVGYALVVHYHGQRLIDDPVSVLAHLKCQITVLTICRSIPLVEAPYLLPERPAYHDRRAGYIVNIADIVIFAFIRVVAAPVVPARAVTPDDASRLLQSAVRVDQL